MKSSFSLLIFLLISFSTVSLAGLNVGMVTVLQPNSNHFEITRSPSHIDTRSVLQGVSLPPILLAKTWSAGLTDRGLGLANDSSGNLYVTGSSSVNSPRYRQQGILLKYNSTGSLVWQRGWGGVSDDNVGQGVAVDGSGNIYVTGTITTSMGNRVLLLKFNSTGNLLWQDKWGGGYSNENGWGVNVDLQGNVYVSGSTLGYGAGGADVLLLKFNSTGSLLWQHTWGGSGYDAGYGNALDASGDVYVAGVTNSFSVGFESAVLLKFNSTGSLLSQRIWGGNGYAVGTDVAVDDSGNAFLTGQSYTFGGGGSGYGAFLLKYNSTGSLQWQRIFGSVVSTPTYQFGSGVTTDLSGNAYVTGFTTSFGAGGGDLLVLKFNSTGSLLRQNAVGGRGYDFTYAHPLTDVSGDLFVTGQVNEAPPYIVCPGNGVLASSSFSVGTIGNDTLGNPNQPSVATSETVFNPSGSETYAGSGDALLLKLGNNTSPSTSYPCAPSGLIAATSSNNIVLTWTPPTYNGGSPITGYNVYRLGAGQGNVTLLVKLGNQTSYADASATSGTFYYYEVTAVNSLGESGFSNPAYGYLPPTIPSPPTNLNVSAGIGQITLRWGTPANQGGSQITGYRIYRGQSTGSEAYLTTVPDVHSYIDTSVVKGVKYSYYVTAINGIGESPPSNEASTNVTVPVFPSWFGDLAIATVTATTLLITRSLQSRKRELTNH